MHAGAGAFVSALTYQLVPREASKLEKIVYPVVMGTMAGLAREMSKSQFDYSDLGFTVLGSGLGVSFCFAID